VVEIFENPITRTRAVGRHPLVNQEKKSLAVIPGTVLTWAGPQRLQVSSALPHRSNPATASGRRC
jgi:hypothetical protein